MGDNDLLVAVQEALPEFVVFDEVKEDGHHLTFLREGIRVYAFLPGDPRIWILPDADAQVRSLWAHKKAVWDAVRARHADILAEYIKHVAGMDVGPEGKGPEPYDPGPVESPETH